MHFFSLKYTHISFFRRPRIQVASHVDAINMISFIRLQTSNLHVVVFSSIKDTPSRIIPHSSGNFILAER